MSASFPVAARLSGVATSPVRDLLALAARPEVISFAGGLPSPELFDLDGLREAFADALSQTRGRASLQYSTTEGDPQLRAWIGERLTTRGVATDSEDVLVTSGSQQALTLIAAALLDPGAVVAVEDPTYLAALQSFRLAGAQVVTVAGDDDGVDPDALLASIRTHRPSMLYLVPTYANPTGRTTSLERRRAIVRIAAEHGVWVVEDDPYGELRYEGEAPTPLVALPGAASCVLSLGSFSKIGAPGLRLGWVRAPRALLRSLVIAKQAADLHSSTIDQAAAALYLGRTDLDAHIRMLRHTYRDRRDAMLAALPAALPAGSAWTRPAGGMFVWASLPAGTDAEAVLTRALALDVAFVPGAAFYAGAPDRSTLRLSFTTHAPPVIEEGLARLAGAFAA
ncbi:PLP-dependent aminotransferase family protein [Microbacterium sp. NPDC091313]